MQKPFGAALVLLVLALAACTGKQPPVLQEVQFTSAPAAQ